MRDRLIELIDDFAFICPQDCEKIVSCNYCKEVRLADYLLANGVVVIDTDVVSPENRPLITHIAGMPINDVIELVEAKKGGAKK